MLVWNLVDKCLLPYFAPNLEISMRRILSERNLVVILFFLALIVFVFAHSETKQMEMLYMDQGSAISTLSTPHEPLTKVEAGSLPKLGVVPAR
jgi:Na+/H+ antiporter NhaD/arsenite permease-like protein